MKRIFWELMDALSDKKEKKNKESYLTTHVRNVK